METQIPNIPISHHHFSTLSPRAVLLTEADRVCQ